MTYTMYSLNFSTLKKIYTCIFSVIHKFETLMQESIKKVINIHKCKFFLCELAGRPAQAADLCRSVRTNYRLMRAGPLRTYGLTTLVHHVFFSRAGPTS